MSPFLDRSKRSDPHLEWKVRLFAVAAVLAVCGIYFEERWMTGTAIGVLAIAMLLRFLPTPDAGPGGRHAEPEPGEPAGPVAEEDGSPVERPADDRDTDTGGDPER